MRAACGSETSALPSIGVTRPSKADADDFGKCAKGGFDAGDIGIEEFIAQVSEELRLRGQASVLYSKAIDD
ncbi:hypothetical protein [Lysobacter sp. CA196]|uniref:hypothetical protein n=1 Tax=Lysobacter sp. CA196 TaxID=3455606 RepID=UPI003F8D8D89